MLFWAKPLNIQILSFSIAHIDYIVGQYDGIYWHFLGFYGASNTSQRKHTWELLKRLKDSIPTLLWLVMGDFNEIMWPDNKLGGPPNQIGRWRTSETAWRFVNYYLSIMKEIHVLGIIRAQMRIMSMTTDK